MPTNARHVRLNGRRRCQILKAIHIPTIAPMPLRSTDQYDRIPSPHICGMKPPTAEPTKIANQRNGRDGIENLGNADGLPRDGHANRLSRPGARLRVRVSHIVRTIAYSHPILGTHTHPRRNNIFGLGSPPPESGPGSGRVNCLTGRAPPLQEFGAGRSIRSRTAQETAEPPLQWRKRSGLAQALLGSPQTELGQAMRLMAVFAAFPYPTSYDHTSYDSAGLTPNPLVRHAGRCQNTRPGINAWVKQQLNRGDTTVRPYPAGEPDGLVTPRVHKKASSGAIDEQPVHPHLDIEKMEMCSCTSLN